jgi:hypothetical protein
MSDSNPSITTDRDLFGSDEEPVFNSSKSGSKRRRIGSDSAERSPSKSPERSPSPEVLDVPSESGSPVVEAPPPEIEVVPDFSAGDSLFSKIPMRMVPRKKKTKTSESQSVGSVERRHLAVYRKAVKELRQHMAERMYAYSPRTIPQKFLKNGGQLNLTGPHSRVRDHLLEAREHAEATGSTSVFLWVFSSETS